MSVKSSDSESKRERERYYHHGMLGSPNPWPSPGSLMLKEQQPRKMGGGFGLPRATGEFGSMFREKEKCLLAARDVHSSSGASGFGFGARDLLEKERCVTPTPTERLFSSNFSASRYSESPTKRARSGRRTGRRGPRGPGHCFHCQEHGHISKMCPRKMMMGDEFLGSGDAPPSPMERGFARDKDIPALSSIVRQGDQSSDSAKQLESQKLESQRARASYYFEETSVQPKSRALQSPEVDKFSEQLDNALNLHNAAADVTNRQTKAPGAQIMGFPSKKAEMTPPPAPMKIKSAPIRDEMRDNSASSQENFTIETRRTVKLDGECHIEETTVINFPRNLPPNVRVIAAQFVPVASSTPQS